LLGLTFADASWGWVAWFAIVPWWLALRHATPAQGFAMGTMGGLVAALLTFGWLSSVPAFGAPQFIVLGSYVALYAACWCAGFVLLHRRGLPLLVFAPMLWVALDLVRHHAGFLALPIASLGQSQHAYPAVLQIAALGGEHAVTWLVVLGNGAIALLIERRDLRQVWLAGTAIATVWASGAVVLVSAHGDGGAASQVSLAAIQPVIDPHERETTAGREAVWQRLERLTLEAARTQPDLIVWPEGAVGDPRHDSLLASRLATLAGAARTTLLVGSYETEKFVLGGEEATVVRERDAYNAAYQVRDGAPLGEPYRKRRLMPFGEYTPLEGVVAWPRWLVPAIAQGRAGDRDADFELIATSPLRLGVVICWENLFADLSRSAVRGGAQVLVQLTNDAWFPPGRAATQHNAASVLRAVENRVPLVLASNAGPSLVIDAYGRVISRTDSQFSREVAVGSVAFGHGTTLYTRLGDWFALACCAGALIGSLTPRPRVAQCEQRQYMAAAKETP
jgi:apolipoprotein N-acyltransferase